MWSEYSRHTKGMFTFYYLIFVKRNFSLNNFLIIRKIFFKVRVCSTGSFVAKLGYEKPEKLSEISIKGQKIQKIAFVAVRQIQ